MKIELLSNFVLLSGLGGLVAWAYLQLTKVRFTILPRMRANVIVINTDRGGDKRKDQRAA